MIGDFEIVRKVRALAVYLMGFGFTAQEAWDIGVIAVRYHMNPELYD